MENSLLEGKHNELGLNTTIGVNPCMLLLCNKILLGFELSQNGWFQGLEYPLDDKTWLIYVEEWTY